MESKARRLRKWSEVEFDCIHDENERKKIMMPIEVKDAATNEVLALTDVCAFRLDYHLKTFVSAIWPSRYLSEHQRVKGAFRYCLLRVVEVRINRDQDSVLFLVEVLKKGRPLQRHKDENGNWVSDNYKTKVRRLIKEEAELRRKRRKQS